MVQNYIGPVRFEALNVLLVPVRSENQLSRSEPVRAFSKIFGSCPDWSSSLKKHILSWSELVLVFLGLGLGSGPVLDFVRSWVVQFWAVVISAGSI